MGIVALTRSPRLMFHGCVPQVHVWLTTIFVRQATLIEINLGLFPKIRVLDFTDVRFIVGC